MTPDLMLLVDGRLPTGAHAYSAGVEAAVRVGDVVDTTTLLRYLNDRLAVTGRVDAAFAASACARAHRGDDLDDLDAEYGARVLSPYLRATSRRLGRQLLCSARVIWPAVPDLDGAHQAIVLGAVVAAANGTARDAGAVALHHLGAAVCSSAVRLLGLDPIQLAAVQAAAGRRAAAMLEEVEAWVNAPIALLPADGGLLTDILGEHHGSSDARMFVA
jgi:urease accessory protein